MKKLTNAFVVFSLFSQLFMAPVSYAEIGPRVIEKIDHVDRRETLEGRTRTTETIIYNRTKTEEGPSSTIEKGRSEKESRPLGGIYDRRVKAIMGRVRIRLSNLKKQRRRRQSWKLR